MEYQGSRFLCGRVTELREAIARGEKMYRRGVASWATGKSDKAVYSSQIEANECVLDCESGDCVTDTINVPAIRNAKGRKQVFNTSEYTAKIKEDAIDVLPEVIEEFREYTCGLVLVNANTMIYENHLGSSVHDVLEELGFELDFVSDDGESAKYKDSTNPARVLLVHYPYGVGGDSDVRVIKKVLRRQITICIHTDFVRLLDGKPHLSDRDTTRNPVNGMLSYQIIWKGFHLDKRIAAAFWRQCIAGANANCLLDNGLKQLVSRDAAVPKNLREIARGSKRVANDQQPVYSDINHRARCLVCEPHSIETIVANLNELFESRKRTDTKVPSKTKTRERRPFWRITLLPTRRLRGFGIGLGRWQAKQGASWQGATR